MPYEFDNITKALKLALEREIEVTHQISILHELSEKAIEPLVS